MEKYIYTGVENTNGNRYEKTITVKEFMETIDIESMEICDVRRYLIENCLYDTPYEHVDTYLKESGMWRVQIWCRIPDVKTNDSWLWLCDAMNIAMDHKELMPNYQFDYYKGFNCSFTFEINKNK